MYYPELESLLDKNVLAIATESDVEIMDKFLASLNHQQAVRLSPWRVARKTGVEQDAIIEVFLQAVKLNLLTIRYEVWHPRTRITIFSTFDQSKIGDPIECSEEPNGEYLPTDSDVHLSFRLNEIKNIDAADLKKKEMHQTDLGKDDYDNEEERPSDPTLDQLMNNPVLATIYKDCTFNVTQITQGDQSNAAASGATAHYTATGSNEKRKSGLSSLWTQVTDNKLLSTLIFTLIISTPFWKDIVQNISARSSKAVISTDVSSNDQHPQVQKTNSKNHQNKSKK